MKWITIFCILLVFGHLLTEAAEVLQTFWPGIASQKIRPWLDRSYVFYGDPDGVQLSWFVKYFTDDILWLISFFCFTMLAYRLSFRLFLIGCIFVLYHAVDLFMLWYNYKTFNWLYWYLIGSCITAVICLFIPVKQRAVIKYMK